MLHWSRYSRSRFRSGVSPDSKNLHKKHLLAQFSESRRSLSFLVLVRPKFVIGIAVPFCSDGEMIFLHPPSIAWKLRPVWCLVRVQAKLPLGRPPLSTEKAVDYGWRRACGRTWLAGKSLLFPQHKHLPRIVRRRGKVVVCWEPIHTCFRVEGPIPAQILCQIPMLQN